MITVLLYLVIAALIGVVVFFLAVVVFGRGEQMAPLDPRTAPAELPEADIRSADVTALRFSMALRGYRMSDVDWALARLAGELQSVRNQNEAFRQQLALTDPGHPLLAIGSGTPGDGPAADTQAQPGPAGSATEPAPGSWSARLDPALSDPALSDPALSGSALPPSALPGPTGEVGPSIATSRAADLESVGFTRPEVSG